MPSSLGSAVQTLRYFVATCFRSMGVSTPFDEPIEEPLGKATPLCLPETRSPEYLHNRCSSTFYRLPVEIHYLVADYLPPTSIITLRLTGRHFYNLFKNPSFASINAVDRMEYQRLKAEDNYQWNLRREARYPLRRLNKVTCSRCRNLHEKDSFTPAMLKEPQTRRICIGAQGRVALCKHQSFTFDEMQELAWKEMTIAFGDVHLNCRLCLHPDHGASGYDLLHSAPFLGLKKREGVRIEGPYVLSRAWTLTTVKTNASVAQSTFKKLLCDLNEHLCPHVSTKDVVSYYPDAMFEKESSFFPFACSGSDEDRPSCDSSGACRQCATVRSFCPVEQCDTSWIFFRRHKTPIEEKDELVLALKRKIGPGREYLDPLTPNKQGWLAQIEKGRGEKSNKHASKVVYNAEERESCEQHCADGRTFLNTYPQADPFVIFFRAQGMSECYMAPMKRELKSLNPFMIKRHGKFVEPLPLQR